MHRGCHAAGTWFAVAVIGTALMSLNASGQKERVKVGTEPAKVSDVAAESYRDLLRSLNDQRLDLANDEFTEIEAKSTAARQAIEAFTKSLLNEAISNEAISLIAQDYVMYRNATSPRLTGRIVRVGPQGDFADLQAAAAKFQTGDLVLIGPGSYQLPETRSIAVGWNDIALVGRGAGLTTLTVGRRGEIEAAGRLRLESMRIDCGDNYLCDIRQGGSLHIRECHISRYNTGAGGSSAVNTNGGAVLIEECAFEGLTGRAARPGSGGGRAFDLRGRNWLYVRQTQFIDNDEIVRALFPCIFDGCRILNSGASGSGVEAYPEGLVLLRDSSRLITRAQPLGPVTMFTYTTDDIEIIRHVLGQAELDDERGRLMVETLLLRRRLPYWIGLLRHENAEIRVLAASHLSKLAGMEVSSSPVERADDDGALTETGAALKAELEFARLMAWYDQNKAALRWDENAGRYVVPPK